MNANVLINIPLFTQVFGDEYQSTDNISLSVSCSLYRDDARVRQLHLVRVCAATHGPGLHGGDRGHGHEGPGGMHLNCFLLKELTVV